MLKHIFIKCGLQLPSIKIKHRLYIDTAHNIVNNDNIHDTVHINQQKT